MIDIQLICIYDWWTIKFPINILLWFSWTIADRKRRTLRMIVMLEYPIIQTRQIWNQEDSTGPIRCSLFWLALDIPLDWAICGGSRICATQVAEVGCSLCHIKLNCQLYYLSPTLPGKKTVIYRNFLSVLLFY